MKNIFKNYIALLLTILVAVSCDYDPTNFDALSDSPDPNATYYIQFKDAAKTLETGVSEEGDIIDIETTITVGLLGLPQSQDININFTVDPATTIDASMYTLSGNSITIPAGSVAGSVSLITNTDLMPVGESLKLILNVDAGDNTATAGTQLAYNLLRIEFCPLENGALDLEGSYSVTENGDGFENSITAVADGANLLVSGIGVSFINDFWEEDVIDGGTFSMEVAGNGLLNIPRQYLFTTEYSGNPYDYEISGSGKWENCDDKPVLKITYDIFYVGDSKGLAETYASNLPNPFLSGTFTMN